MTSALRCSDSRLASGAELWVNTSVLPSIARTVAPASITSVVRLRWRTLSRTVGHIVRTAAALGSPGMAAGSVAGTGVGSAAGTGVGSGLGFDSGGAGPPWRAAGLGNRLSRRGLGRRGRRRRRGDRHVQPGLDPLDALQQRRLGIAGRGQQQSRADHFEQQARRGRTAHLTQPGLHHLGVAGQGRRAQFAPPARASGPARPPGRPRRRVTPHREPLAAR